MVQWTVTVEEVLQRVNEARELDRRDPIAARAAAETLRSDVLRAIADGAAQDDRALAKAAMITVDEGLGSPS